MTEVNLNEEPASERSSVLDSKRMVETRDLIEMVHRRRCLWDRTHNEYRNRYVKNRAWKEIYKEVEPSYDSLKGALRHQIGLVITKKWYNVRDSYVKSKKATRTARPYIYADELTFLDSVLKHEEQNYKEDKVANDSEGENWLGEVFVDVEDNAEDVASKRAKYDFNLSKEDSASDSLREENVVSILANIIRKEEDDDRAFFKSITPAVKTLSQEGKLEFRIMVMKLLKGLKEREKVIVKKELSIPDSDSE